MTKKIEVKKKTTEEKTDDTDKVFDVSRPGESMPSATSRPVIITGRTTVGDPMVSPVHDKKEDEKEDEETSRDAGDEGMIMSAPKKNRIEPLHTTIVAEDESEDEQPKSQDKDVDTKQADERTDEAEDAQEIAEVASEVSTKKQTQVENAKKQDEAEKKQAEIEALVNNKQYFVPINAVQKQRSMRFVLLSLGFLLLVVAGALAAADAGLIELGIDAPTDFIQDK